MTDHAATASRSSTAMVLDELQLHGYRPFAGELDPRPLPEADSLQGALTDIFDALVASLSDTRLEPDLEDLLWSTTNVFHRMAAKLPRRGLLIVLSDLFGDVDRLLTALAHLRHGGHEEFHNADLVGLVYHPVEPAA